MDELYFARFEFDEFLLITYMTTIPKELFAERYIQHDLLLSRHVRLDYV